MDTNPNQRAAPSPEKFPGETFVGALEEYTKRIEATVAELDSILEGTLSRMFALLIFIMVLAGVVPLIMRVSNEFEGSPLYHIFLQTTMLAALIAIIGLTLFTVYTRLIRLRRHRRNLETLLWPYQKLLQKLSQIVDQGNLDEGTSTLIQLKILEAEVAFSRARRLVKGPRSFSLLGFLFGFEPSGQFEPWEVAMLADRYRLPLEEAELLLRRFGNDRHKLHAEAEERSRHFR